MDLGTKQDAQARYIKQYSFHTDPAVRRPGWNEIGISFAWIIAFFMLQGLCGAIAIYLAVSDAAGGGTSLSDMQAMSGNMNIVALPIFISLAVAQILSLFGLYFYLKRPEKSRVLGLNRWSRMPTPQTIGVAIAIILCCLLFNAAYTTYLMPDVEMQAQMRAMLAAIPETLPNQILLFVTIAVLAPIAEEILFRGLLQTSLGRYLPWWAAIIISAILFGAVHGQPEALLPLAMLGAGFGLIYHLTGSLRTCIILHVINNSAALLIPKFIDLPETTEASGRAAGMILLHLFG